jgi:hypothetical protein
MSGAFSNEELAYLQSLATAHDIPPLTRQQEKFLLYYFRGASQSAAARVVGVPLSRAKEWLASENFRVFLEYMEERRLHEIEVSRGMLTNMLFEAHDTAATATEKIAAIKELGKMHDVYPKADTQPTVIINQVTDQTLKQLDRMSDAELAKLAGDVLIEGEIVDD